MAVTNGCTKNGYGFSSHCRLGMGVVGAHAEALLAEDVLAVEIGTMAKDVVLTID